MHPNQPQELGSNDDRLEEVREQPQEMHPNQPQELGSSGDRTDELVIKNVFGVFKVSELSEQLLSGFTIRQLKAIAKKLKIDSYSIFDRQRLTSAITAFVVMQQSRQLHSNQPQESGCNGDRTKQLVRERSQELSSNQSQALPELGSNDDIDAGGVSEQPQELHPNQLELGSSDCIEEVREQPQELYPNQPQELGSNNSLSAKHIEKITTRLKDKGCDFHSICGWLEEKLVKVNSYIYYRCRYFDTKKILSIYVGKV